MYIPIKACFSNFKHAISIKNAHENDFNRSLNIIGVQFTYQFCYS